MLAYKPRQEGTFDKCCDSTNHSDNLRGQITKKQCTRTVEVHVRYTTTEAANPVKTKCPTERSHIGLLAS